MNYALDEHLCAIGVKSKLSALIDCFHGDDCWIKLAESITSISIEFALLVCSG